MSERGYKWIWQKKRQRKQSSSELLALSTIHDPFYIGSATDWKQARWFAKAWEKCRKDDSTKELHLRRVHYFLQASGKYKKLDCMPYRNIGSDWNWLQRCSKCARVLGTAEADAFEDKRNEDVTELDWRQGAKDPDVIRPYLDWYFRSIRVSLLALDWSLGHPSIAGYSPNDYEDRTYYTEVWAEKSTVNDVLEPLADELRIPYLPGAGYQSITNVVRLLKRIHELGKPARLFYVSDYDGAGRNMPCMAAQWMEFYREKYASGADIKLLPVVLTKEQVEHYELPLNEDGSAELDALEALHPGELGKIVRDAVAPYLDETIDDRLADAEQEARDIAEDDWQELVAPYRQTLEALQKKVRSVAKRYEKEAAALSKRLARDLKAFGKSLTRLRSEIERGAEDFDPELPERPTQVESERHEESCLFDSSRDYFTQLPFYKKRRA